MPTERSVNSTIRTTLINNEAFEYAHLIKFERPQLPNANNTFSTNANKFVYLTDGARDISFNDGSTNDSGSANGSQIYRANKLLNVTGYKESMQAKATSMTLTIAAETLGTSVIGNLTFSGSTITCSTLIDFVEEGFKEGDKIKLEANDGSGSNHNKIFLITGFTSSNQNITIETLDDAFTTNSTGELYTLSLESEEIKGPLTARGTDLANPSFLNKNVEVHKVFLDPETGEIKGNASILIFKGLITKTNINEDPSKSSRVTWTLNSHWADFSRLQGRMTSDETHRALTTEGTPQKDAALKPDYAYDMGFMHGDTSVNVLATYQEKYFEPKLKTSSHGLFGIKKKVQMSMEEKFRDRDVKLAIEMSAKYLPVVYGVRKVPGIPVFADTPSNDPDTIYIVYAICEGEIEALYDIYIDGQPLICLNKPDFDDRNTSVSEPSSPVLCAGRADRGETLSGSTAIGGGFSIYNPGPNAAFSGEDFETSGEAGDYRPVGLREYSQVAGSYQNLASSVSISGGNTSDVGIRNNQQFQLTTPQNIKLWFHSGRFDQLANSQLITVAEGSKFKRQLDYFSSNEEYWSPDHRLLDTAYVVAEVTVTEEAPDIPELEFVVKGKIYENYNYDYKYRHDDLSHSSESAANFIPGESITFYRTSDDTALNTTKVKDVYKIANPETGDMMDVIRFGDKPFHSTNFPYVDDVPTHTEFYAKDASNNTWHMLTFNHTDLTATLPDQGSSISSISRDNTSRKLKITVADTALSGVTEFKILGTGNGQLENIEESTLTGTYSNQVITLDVTLNALTGSDTISSGRVIESRTIKLPSSASSSDNFYNNQIIEVTSGTGVNEERTIVDYNGTTKVATLRSNFINHPNASSGYNISGRGKDLRSANNPAMHTLDYLTAKTYGKGLSLTDLSLETFNNAARTCDARSEITISTTTSPTVGDEYLHTADGSASGAVIARGTVKSVTATSTHYDVVLEDVYGQFQRLWSNWSYYEVGDIIFTEGDGNIFRVTSAGYIGTKPTNASPQGTTYINNVTFYKAGATGTTLTSFYKKYVQKHSLYNADFVKYWRWLGWAHDNQRWVTRHQMNSVIETTSSLFENTTSMLEHYNGMLSYSNGKYELEIEAQEDTPADNGVYHITQADIIGNLNVTDDPSRKSFNTINASVSDPGNKWSNTSVSFYNSNFVKADRNVVKTGNIKFSGITNYWNGRINAEKFLRESRFPLQISFTTMPKGILMKAGQILKCDYDRFGWNDKLFRIVDLDIQPDCLVRISAVEYNDDMYVISNARKTGVTNTEIPGTALTGSPGAPTTLTASTDKFGTTVLNWTKATTFVEATDCTEIWASDVNDRSDSSAEKVGEADDETTFSHAIGAEAAKYYWIRHKRTVRKRKSKQKGNLFSAFFPASSTAGVAGTALQAAAITVTITNPSMTLQETSAGSINYTGSGTDIQVLLGESILVADQDGAQANNTFRVSASASNITAGSSSVVNDGNGNATIVRFGAHSSATTDTPVITYTITVKNAVGSTIILTRFQHFAVVTDGVVGADGLSIVPTNGTHNFVGDSTGAASATSFSCEFNIREGTTTFTYDGTSPYGDNTFRYGTLTDTNVVSAVSSSGVITITGSSSILSGTGAGNEEGSIVVPIYDNSDDTLLTTQIISLTKTTAGADGANAQTVKLIPSKHVINYSTAGAESDSITFTNEAFNFTTPYYRFLVDGVQKQAYSTTSTFTLADADEPAIDEVVNVKVEVKENNTGNVAASDVVSIFAVQDGSDAVTGFLTNASHTVTANSAGTVSSFSGAGGTFKVFVGGTDVTTSCTFSTPSGTGVAGSINSSSGVYTITGMSADQGVRTFQAVIPAATAGTASNVTITADYSISKSIAGAAGTFGQRGGSIFTFEESTTSGISATNASNFADSNFSNADAVAIGTAVIAASEDNDLVSNDRITVTDNSANKAGTRVYTGSRVTSASSLQASDFSSLVVETFDGSVIVDGTLSANKLSANTTLTNNLNVGSNMILGSSGQFYSQNKTSFTDTDGGLYMDGTGDFHVGDSNSFIKFDVSAGTLDIKANTMTFSSGDGVSTFDGAYGSLTGTPTLFSGNYVDLVGTPTFVDLTLPNGDTFSPTGTAVTLSTSGLGITSAYMAGQNALVFGTTNIQGGRILLTSSGKLEAQTNTTTSAAGPNSSIDINSHTQQIIISDAS